MTLLSRSIFRVLLLVCCVLAGGVSAAELWAVSARGGEGVVPSNVETFRRLLQDELTNRGKQTVAVTPECTLPGCAAQAGLAVNATMLVESELLPLGQKLLVRAELRDLRSGQVKTAQRLTASSAEELDVIAPRLAEALVSGRSAQDTGEVGQAIVEEEKGGRYRGGRSGVSLSAVGVLPVGGRGYGDGDAGVGLDLGYWFETRHFALEPRAGLHFDGDGGRSRYTEFPMDLGVYWLPLATDVTPFLGVTAGLHYLTERRLETVTVGNVFVSTHEAELEDSGWGFGAGVRGGLELFRTYKLRMLLTGEYGVTFIDLNGRRNPRVVRLGFGVIF